MVGCGVSEGLKRHPGAQRPDGWRRRPSREFFGSEPHRSERFFGHALLKPGKDLRQLSPEVVEWRQRRQLMSEHIAPLALKFGSKARVFNILHLRHSDRFCEI